MKKVHFLLIGISTILFTACQTAPQGYNGVSGYQIEQQNQNTALLSYTLAARTSEQKTAQRLQAACQKVLGQKQNYQIKILSQNEIINPQQDNSSQGIQIGHSRASFGLSNTPDLKNADNYAANQALDARPDTLKVIRYICE